MHVRQFFRPQYAVKAVQNLKARDWSELEFLELLESISQHGNLASLPQVSQKALFAHLPSIVNPLIRHSCLAILGDAYPTQYSAFIGLSYLASNDIEKACIIAKKNQTELVSLYKASTENVASTFVNKLIDQGAMFFQAQSEQMWTRLLEVAIYAENINKVRELWSQKPVDVILGEPLMLELINLTGRSRDKALLRQILEKMNHDLPLTSGAISACLACFTSDTGELIQLLDDHQNLIDAHLMVQDARVISDALASQVIDICETRKHGISTGLGNLLLQGLYRQNTSQTVFHFYRYLINNRSFEPNEATAQILVNAAFRLGNSKLLSYEIWHEFSNRHGLPLGRKFYETVLMCQMVGSNYTSVMFFLAEMARSNIKVRNNIQRLIHNKFERDFNTSPLLEIMSSDIRTKFRYFDVEKAASESAPATLQAESNAKLFIEGKDPHEEPLAVLSKMLAFDLNRRKT